MVAAPVLGGDSFVCGFVFMVEFVFDGRARHLACYVSTREDFSRFYGVYFCLARGV